MPASERHAASASLRIRSNTLPRWLCSMIPMPLPATFQMASCALRRTGSGSTAGPALKLWMRSVIAGPFDVCRGGVGVAVILIPTVTPSSPVDLAQLHADDVLIARPDPLDRPGIGHAVEMDPRQRGVRAMIDDVFDLLHVDRAAGEHAEHVG